MIYKRNYITGDFEEFSNESIGQVTDDSWNYFSLDGFWKFEISDPVLETEEGVIHEAAYELKIDGTWTGRESGYSGKILYAMWRIVDSSYFAKEIFLSGKNFGTMVDNEVVHRLSSSRYPVGSAYTQYPGCDTPAAAGLPGTWVSQFENEGIFFRTPGGNARAFGSGRQGMELQRHSHKTTLLDTYVTLAADHFPSRRTAFDYALSSGKQGGVETFSTGGYETRPVNRTFRIWKRIA